LILPTKYLSHERSLIGIGAIVIELLNEPKTVSRLWDEIKNYKKFASRSSALTYDWFVLALDLLFIMNAILYKQGKIWRTNHDL
jgi:hypothetical protein